jgi:hypothetical protein
MAVALLGLALAWAAHLHPAPQPAGRWLRATPRGPAFLAAASAWPPFLMQPSRGRRPAIVAMQMEPFQQQQAGGSFGSEDISISSGAAFLVGLDIKRDKYKTLAGDWEQDALWSIDDSLDELERLCDTAGLQVLGRDSQALPNPSASTFIGAGKVEELGAPPPTHPHISPCPSSASSVWVVSPLFHSPAAEPQPHSRRRQTGVQFVRAFSSLSPKASSF